MDKDIQGGGSLYYILIPDQQNSFKFKPVICHEVTQGIRQKPPTRSNRYNVKGKCEMWRGVGGPCDPHSHGLLAQACSHESVQKESANSCAAWTPARAESRLIIALSSSLDNMVSILWELMVKMYLNEYSISLLCNKFSSLYNTNIDKDTHSHHIWKPDCIILSSREKWTPFQ